MRGMVTKVTGRGDYWDAIYRARRAEEVSWYQRVPVMSLQMLFADGASPASVVDVGAGESRLVDHLLVAGVEEVTLLDVSQDAVRRTWERLGRDPRVHFVATDVTTWRPTEQFDAWHDRATFHFLTGADERAAYARTAAGAVVPGGRCIIGTFAADGPDACSGLSVQRHTADDIAAEFADAFDLEHTADEDHVTPGGAHQHFVWVVLRRR